MRSTGRTARPVPIRGAGALRGPPRLLLLPPRLLSANAGWLNAKAPATRAAPKQNRMNLIMRLRRDAKPNQLLDIITSRHLRKSRSATNRTFFVFVSGAANKSLTKKGGGMPRSYAFTSAASARGPASSTGSGGRQPFPVSQRRMTAHVLLRCKLPAVLSYRDISEGFCLAGHREPNARWERLMRARALGLRFLPRLVPRPRAGDFFCAILVPSPPSSSPVTTCGWPRKASSRSQSCPNERRPRSGKQSWKSILRLGGERSLPRKHGGGAQELGAPARLHAQASPPSSRIMDTWEMGTWEWVSTAT